jgi:hypothetical protein
MKCTTKGNENQGHSRYSCLIKVATKAKFDCIITINDSLPFRKFCKCFECLIIMMNKNLLGFSLQLENKRTNTCWLVCRFKNTGWFRVAAKTYQSRRYG